MKKRKLLLWGLVSFFVLSCISAFIVYQMYTSALGGISVEPPDDSSGKNPVVREEERPLEDPFSILLYGIDERPALGDEGRPDTMLLALIDPKLLKLSLISIPRDSYVSIPGHGKDKINHTYPLGGPQLTIQTIEEWLGTDIYGYTAINFNGFRELVDLVGGVDVYVDRNMRYDSSADNTHINLKKGQQVLDGKNALDFVRARKDNRGPRYYSTDYQRMERQQQVLKALGDKIISVQSLPKVFDMLNVLEGNVKTTLTPEELDFLIRKFYRFNMGDLETTSIQGTALQKKSGWYEEVGETELTRIKHLIENFMERKPEGTETKVEQ
jgi:LCP family protein required for cell wall assembly